jgi:hypothetical protein
MFPVLCGFPGCDRPAPLAVDPGDTPLCVEHERLRFYAPNEFDRQWRTLDPERS